MVRPVLQHWLICGLNSYLRNLKKNRVFTRFFICILLYLFVSYSSCSSTVIVANGRANKRGIPISSPEITL